MDGSKWGTPADIPPNTLILNSPMSNYKKRTGFTAKAKSDHKESQCKPVVLFNHAVS